MALYTYRDKQDRHERPSGVRYNDETNRRYDGSLVDTKPLYGPHRVHRNQYEAMMEARPHEECGRTELDADGWDDLITDYLNVLTPKEKSVIELVVFGQMSLFQAGIMLGEEYGHGGPYSKMMVSKYRDSALEKMRAHAIKPRLDQGDNETDRGRGTV